MRLTFIAILLFIAGASPANAYVFYLEQVTMDDGTSVRGSFNFEEEASTVLIIKLLTESGPGAVAQSYDEALWGGDDGFLAGNGSDNRIKLEYDLAQGSMGSQVVAGYDCGDSSPCGSYEYNSGNYRYITGGFVSTVPIPAAVWLFGSALAGLGWMRRRKAV